MAADLADVALEAQRERPARDGDLVTAYVKPSTMRIGMVAVHETTYQKPVAFLTSERKNEFSSLPSRRMGMARATAPSLRAFGVIGHEEQVPREQQLLHQALSPCGSSVHVFVFRHEAVLHDGAVYQTAAHLSVETHDPLYLAPRTMPAVLFLALHTEPFVS